MSERGLGVPSTRPVQRAVLQHPHPLVWLQQQITQVSPFRSLQHSFWLSQRRVPDLPTIDSLLTQHVNPCTANVGPDTPSGSRFPVAVTVVWLVFITCPLPIAALSQQPLMMLRT